MTDLSSKINAVEARIRQIEISDLYTDSEREHRLKEALNEFAKLISQTNQITVNQPEILS